MYSDISDNESSRNSRQSKRPARSRMPVVIAPQPDSSMRQTASPPDSWTQSFGLSDPDISAERRRKLDAINRLHSIGAQLDIDIPQIVVVGSQSAGKSSLIESISGITLPRASGTCTRCPTECRLVQSTEPWQCTVSLRFMTDELGRVLERVKNVPFGPLIKNPKEVEDRLRRAQRAVLNPTIDPLRFLENQQFTETTLNFSTNCVSLEIKGPEVTDLSFCDLPGLIASVSGNGREEDIEEVRQLVSSYISKPSCIILLAIACESDFETQGAYRLAKHHDKNGTKTIGVLTKPDRIPEGEETRWMKLIKNETSALQNGWYCVKQPSTIELNEGVTFREARHRGQEFFKKLPWSRLEPRYQKKLGTHAVTQKLNIILIDHISKRFPEIMKELQDILQETKAELQNLPPPTSKDPLLELMHLIGGFSDDIYRDAEGFSHHIFRNSTGFSNQFQPILKAHEEFRIRIRETVPFFEPFEGAREEVPETLLSSDVEPTFLRSEEADRVPPRLDPLDIDQVAQRVLEARTRELPGYYPYHIVQDLISRSTDCWKEPAHALIETIHQTVVEHQNTLIQKFFAHYTDSGLYKTVLHIMHEYMQKRRDDSVQRVEWLLELEAHAFTLNTYWLDDYKDKFLAYYKSMRQNHPGNWRSNDEPRPWNSQQSALEIMATVRAYFQVAYKRVVDTIPLAIDRELVRIDKRGVQDALCVGLKMTGPEAPGHCKRLLAEPAEIVARREDLETRLERLIAAQRELVDV